MKRLILLTLLLVPFAITTVNRFAETTRCGVPVRPRLVHIVPDPAGRGTQPPAEVLVEVANKYPMATEESAVEAAWKAVDQRLASRLGERGISENWRAPRELLSVMVVPSQLDRIEKDYGTVFVQTLLVDESKPQIDRLVEAHEREVAGCRLVKLGGLLSFLLVCLGTLSAYIRTDEATKGYYTRSLQAVSLVAIGAAGSAAYLWLI